MSGPTNEQSAAGDSDGSAADTTVIDRPASDPGPSVRLARGTNVGRYVVLDFVGSGGMGVVYSAFDPELDRKLAIKLVRPEARSGDAGPARDRLLREAQAMAKLSHPNVLPIFDVGTYEDSVFIAVELVEGSTLRAWLQAEPRRWTAIVDVFVAAARGLAAAHAEGLVHRDFKPENVLVGQRGAVRVMDFGLARAAFDAETSATSHDRAGIAASSQSGHLTKTGLVMGTPAYMAPEQHRSPSVDPRADQFAFCVALYEAVFGRRPFAGRTAQELAAAAIAQKFEPVPAAAVPGWLRRVVVRGLAAAPEDRWPDMNALSAALSHDHGRRWRALGIVGATTVIAVTIGFAYGRHGDANDPCAALAGEPEGWDADRRAALATSFASSGLAYADATWSHVEPMLDRHVRTWADARREACEATRVRMEQSDAAFDLQLECLALRRTQLDALLAVFDTADAGVVEHAVTSVAALEPIEGCLVVDPQRERTAPPPADRRARIDALRRELADASARRGVARYAEAAKIAGSVVVEADDIGWLPLRAEAGLLAGQLQADLGDVDGGAKTVAAAAELAEAERMDELVARAHTSLVSIVGVLGGRTDEGERWAKLAAAKLQRVGDLPRVEAQLAIWRASVADAAGDYALARRYTEQGVAAWQELDPEGPDHALALGNLGRVAYRVQDFEGALAAFRHAHDVAVASYGPQHPEVAKLLSNMAACYTSMGRLDEAQKVLEQGLVLLEAALEDDHPDIAITLTNLAGLAYRQQRYEDAIAISRRVIAMRKRTLGPRSPKLTASLNNLAVSLMALERNDEAIAAYREAAEIFDHAYPEGHPEALMVLMGIGEIELKRDRPRDAIAVLERADRIGATAEGVNPFALAEARFLLARALVGARDRREHERAVELARAAATVLRAGPETEQRHLPEIEAWLAANANAR